MSVHSADMTRATVMYARISDDKAGAGLGVARQREDCEALATVLGLTLDEVYSDNDVSAYSGKKRPRYVEMLEGIRAGRVDVVIAWHPDRLHRAPRELEDYIDAVNTHGVTTHFVKAGQWSLDTAAGRMTARIVGAVDRGESEHKAERIVRAHQQAAEQGRWRGGTRPFGYAEDGQTLVPQESDMLRSASRAILEGKALGALIRDWNAAGVLTTTGKPWGYATLRQVLLRPRNYGASVYRGEVVKENAWVPVVDESTWRSVRAILSDPTRLRSSSNRGKWLLSGLARCGKCEAAGLAATMKSATSRSRGVTWSVYRCSTAVHLARRADYCDEYVAGVVLERLGRADARTLMRGPVTGVDRSRLEADARGLRAQTDEAATLYADGVLTAGQLRSATERIRERLAALEVQMVDPARETALAGILDAPDIQLSWGAMSWKARREVVHALMTVTILPIPAGLPRRFSPEHVRIDWIG